MSRYAYDIRPRALIVGGGWRISLLDDGTEVGAMIFPVFEPDPNHSLAWWATLNDDDRRDWFERCGNVDRFAMHRAHLLDEAFAAAQRIGNDWITLR